MMFLKKRRFLVAEIFFFLLLAIPVSAGADTEVTIHLSEFHLETSHEIVKSGKVFFEVTNKGREDHEFVISKMDDGHFKELKEIEPFAPGTVKAMHLSLEPGSYELSCKIMKGEDGERVDHYEKGMRILFSVVKPLMIGGSGSERKQGAREIPYAKTPFLFATTSNNTQRSLSHQDIVDIYNRSRTTWDDGSRIRIVLRPDTDSDTRILRRNFPEIGSAPFTGKTWRGIPTAYTDQESADLIQSLPGGIGMSTLSLLLSEKRPLKALAIDGVAATPQALVDGSYPLSDMLRSRKVFVHF